MASRSGQVNMKLEKINFSIPQGTRDSSRVLVRQLSNDNTYGNTFKTVA